MTDPISQLSSVPFLRKLWVVVLLTCLLITFPVAMVILLSGPVYRWRDHGWRPISNGARYTYGGLLALWLVAATARAVLQPGGISGEWARSAPTESSPATAASGPATPAGTSEAPKDQAQSASAGGVDEAVATCTSELTIEAVKSAIENASKLEPVEVKDFGNAQETFYDPGSKVHQCVAEAVLSTGSTLVTYQLFKGPSGKPMVQVQTGEKAGMQNVWAQGMKEEFALSAKLAAEHKGSCEPYMDPIAGKQIVSDTCQSSEPAPDQSQDHPHER